MFLLKTNSTGGISCIGGNHTREANLLLSQATGYGPSSCFSPPSPNLEAGWRAEEQSGGGGGARQGASGVSRQEVQDLKEQLEALRCQVGSSRRQPPALPPSTRHPTPIWLALLHSIQTVPGSDAIRAELMSIYCCQGGEDCCSRLSSDELVNCATKWLQKIRVARHGNIKI